MPVIEVTTQEHLAKLKDRVREAAAAASDRLGSTWASGLEMLRAIKFDPIGRHPIEDRDLNLIEQVNQTFTYLVTFEAAAVLFEIHPGLSGLRLNLGTGAGTDIESLEPGLLAAETFAAVTPRNNRKLQKDIERVAAIEAAHRYVFFYSPGLATGRRLELEPRLTEPVQVWVVSPVSST